ncbi:SMI1/KNR4 family protein [Epibacterium sp. DP7N7-1]|nr:SMI1/KNR4 family protein [Epibacterium sp. DP7N7-1]
MMIDSEIRVVPRDLREGASALTISQVEACIDGIKLPALLLNIIPEDGRSVWFDKGVEVEPVEENPIAGEKQRQTVFCLFGLNNGQDGILKNYLRLKGRIDRDLLPIGDDGLDNAFVLDPRTGQVLFWHHECEDGEGSPKALTEVAPSLAAFLSALRPEQEFESVELKRGVKAVRLDMI